MSTALYYIAGQQGFCGERKPVANIRFAKSFESFEDADEFANDIGLRYYAILRTV